jgi:hypothetical protein
MRIGFLPKKRLKRPRDHEDAIDIVKVGEVGVDL